MENTEARTIDYATPYGDRHSVANKHLDSLFFMMLPAELRLKIYDEAFEGSTAKITSLPWHRAATFDQNWMMPWKKWMLRPSQHHQLLLTCHAVYEEAMPVYWSRTVVDMRGDDMYPGAGVMFAVFPSHARQYVQHITNVSYPNGVDRWGYGGWSFAQALSHLPNLKTCRLTDDNWVDCDEVQWFNLGRTFGSDDLTPDKKDRRIISQSLSDISFMDSEVDLFQEPFYSAIVLQKHQARYRRPRDGKDTYQVSLIQFLSLGFMLNWNYECFINHTAEYIYHRTVDGSLADSNDDWSDEYGFQRAIRDAPPVPLRPRVMQRDFNVDFEKNIKILNMLMDRV